MRVAVVAALLATVATSALALDHTIQPDARAVENRARVRTLRVGESVAFNPGELPAQVVCDDLSVVRVDDARTHFELTGLKGGSTLCSFSPVAKPGIRLVYRFDVVP